MDELEKHLQNYVDYLRTKKYSERTIAGYSIEIKLFFKWLKKKNIYKLSEIKSITIQDYQAYLSSAQSSQTKKNYPPSTQRRKLLDLKVFFKFLVKTDAAISEPSKNIVLPAKQKNFKWNLLSLYNIKKILLSIDLSKPLFYRDRTIIEILYTTGMRASEICNLKIGDIDYKSNYIKINSGKGNIDRFVPACSRALDFTLTYIEKYRNKFVKQNSYDFIFLSCTGEKLTKHTILAIIKKYTLSASLDKNFSPHCFRASAATHMLKNGADIRYIQQLLGHKTIDTTMDYLKLEKSELKRIHTASHPRETFRKKDRNE